MVYIAQQSFGFGEVDPNIRAQYDSAPYQRGCQILQNAMLSDTGSAIKRWGSVQFSIATGDKKVFEFYDGYNNRFIVTDLPVNVGLSSENRAYTILVNGLDTTPPTYAARTPVALSEEFVKQVATSGNDLFVLTLDGLYKHEILKDVSGNFTFSRVFVDVEADLISSTPPVSFTPGGSVIDSSNTTMEITASTDWFSQEDVGDLYKITQKANPSNMETNNLWGVVASVTDSSKALIANVDTVHLDDKSTPVTSNTLTITNHGFASSTTARPVKVKWYENGNFYGSATHPADGTELYVKRIGANTIQLFSNQALTGSETTINILYQDSKTFLMKLGNSSIYSTDTNPTSASFEWVGPYRHWVRWGDAVYTNYDYSAAGQSQPTGVYLDGTQWEAWATKSTKKWDYSSGDTDFWGNGSPSGSTATSNDNKKLAMQGGVAKAEHYVAGKLWYTSYFQINHHPFMGDDGAENTQVPSLTHIAGPPLVQANAVTTDPALAETLIWYIATSEDQSSASKPTINGKPFAKNGWNPSLLVRVEDTSPDASSSGVVYPVACVGSNTRPLSYTHSTTTFASGGQVNASTQISNCSTSLSVLVGEEGPPSTSQVFRIGTEEITNANNTPTGLMDKGNGPSAYWKLTGESFYPQESPNTTITNKNLAFANAIEYHQSRVFLGSISPISFATDKGGVLALPESQNLGLTIVSTQSGSSLNFTTGQNAGDGLSFQIQSAIGGEICWLHSQFNQLFVGTNEEEFVITDIPMQPTSINISKQSNYGSLLNSQAVLFGSDIVYIAETGKSLRSMVFRRDSQRYESEDLLQFAKHIVKNDKITKITTVNSETPLLFAFTENKKIWCFSKTPGNNVYGWSEWKQPRISFEDILGTVDNNGYPALLVRYTGLNSLTETSVMVTSDPNRSQYLFDVSEEIDVVNGTVSSATAQILSPLRGETVSCVAIKTNGNAVYIGDYLCNSSTRVIDFGFNVTDCDKVIVGIPFTMKLAPNIPEVMVPGKGSTLGREKNVSRLRILFNQALGAIASGYNVFPVPLDTKDALPSDSPGFYSVPVVGQYGPQPTINIESSAPYGFEVSGYNAEYDFGD